MLKKYVLYGTGLEGEKFFYNHYEMIEQVEYCIDAFHKGEFHGIPIVQIEQAEDLSAYKIFVAAVWETYLKIKVLLEERGLIEYVNFTWASEYGKKLVVINANCHGRALVNYFQCCREFFYQYIVHPIPEIQKNAEKSININLLKNADVFIHQDIRSDNMFGYELSDEYIRKFLKKDCLDIVIPNFVGMGRMLFPRRRGMEKIRGEILGYYRDDIIEEAYRNDEVVSLQQYVKFYEDYEIDGELLEQEYQHCMMKLWEREKNWDVKVTDYIKKNLRKIPCFTDQDHPSRYLMLEVGNQVAKMLGVKSCDEKEIEENALSITLTMPVLKCVQRYFQLEWELPNNKQYNLFVGNHTEENVAEYIKEYIWWYYGVVIEN